MVTALAVLVVGGCRSRDALPLPTNADTTTISVPPMIREAVEAAAADPVAGLYACADSVVVWAQAGALRFYEPSGERTLAVSGTGVYSPRTGEASAPDRATVFERSPSGTVRLLLGTVRCFRVESVGQLAASLGDSAMGSVRPERSRSLDGLFEADTITLPVIDVPSGGPSP